MPSVVSKRKFNIKNVALFKPAIPINVFDVCQSQSQNDFVYNQPDNVQSPSVIRSRKIVSNTQSRKMQREEKQLESLIDAVLNRLNDLKHSIGAMIHMIETEYETINWPTFLDNFALISSHLTGLSKILAHELGPPLRNLTVLPLLLSQEPDEAILHLTEGRIPVFSHDLVPDYLRTKPEPAAEQRMLGHEQKANSMPVETAMKQVSQFTKVISHVYDMVNKSREEWDVESSRSGSQQSSSLSDTHALVAAIGMGKGLIPDAVPSLPARQAAIPASAPNTTGPMGKVPSAIKTNIKSANQIHPYGR